MALILIVITAALIIIALTAILNALVFPRLNRAAPAVGGPLVSVLIPARNEAAVIAQTTKSLLGQNYSPVEILVLDDNSTDGTGEQIRLAANGDARLRVLSGAPLPSGWLGKNWACHQLAQAARGEWLVFTDADVQWSPHALARLAGQLQSTGADLLTIWPTQRTVSWPERLVVPLMALAILGYLPLPLVHGTSWPAFAAANGQCLAFRRRAYDHVGGHAAVRAEIVEDVAFARRIKAAGLRLRMADGAGEIVCRMYQDWPSVRDGFGKNILAGHGNRVPLLALSTLFHWSIFVLPWLWFVSGSDLVSPGAWPTWPLALMVLGVGTRMLTAVATRQRVLDALLLPLSVLLMTLIAFRSLWWRWRYGGPRWKDRVAAARPAGETAHG